MKCPSTERLIELATASLHALMEDDSEQAIIFFEEELSLSEDERDFFGIDFEEEIDF